MAIFLGLWGGLAAFCGFVFFATAKGAIHEIEAALGFLIATVAIGCAGIIESVNRNTKSAKSAAIDRAPAASMSEPFYK